MSKIRTTLLAGILAATAGVCILQQNKSPAQTSIYGDITKPEFIITGKGFWSVIFPRETDDEKARLEEVLNDPFPSLAQELIGKYRDFYKTDNEKFLKHVQGKTKLSEEDLESVGDAIKALYSAELNNTPITQLCKQEFAKYAAQQIDIEKTALDILTTITKSNTAHATAYRKKIQEDLARESQAIDYGTALGVSADLENNVLNTFRKMGKLLYPARESLQEPTGEIDIMEEAEANLFAITATDALTIYHPGLGRRMRVCLQSDRIEQLKRYRNGTSDARSTGWALAEALLQGNNGDYIRAHNYLAGHNNINDLSEAVKNAFANKERILDGPEIDEKIKNMIEKFREIEAKYEK